MGFYSSWGHLFWRQLAVAGAVMIFIAAYARAEHEDPWTAERMLQAKPMPLNTPKFTSSQFYSTVQDSKERYQQKGSCRKREALMMQEPQCLRPKTSYPNVFLSSRVFPPAATTVYPWSTSCRIFFKSTNGGDLACSGSLIGRGLVLTAGHCAHAGNGSIAGDSNQGFYSNFAVVPAFYHGKAPFGVHKVINAIVQREWVLYGWKSPVNPGDFALLVLSPSKTTPFSATEFVGDYTGYLGWQINSTALTHVVAVGYPANLDGGGIMHMVSSETTSDVEQNTVTMGSDMWFGSSGSPWIINFGQRASGQAALPANRVVGVSSYGPSDISERYAGSAILSDAFVEMLDAVCTAYPDQCA